MRRAPGATASKAAVTPRANAVDMRRSAAVVGSCLVANAEGSEAEDGAISRRRESRTNKSGTEYLCTLL